MYINFLERDVNRNQQKKIFIRMVSSQGEELYFSTPYEWSRFDYSELYREGGMEQDYITLAGPSKNYHLIATEIHFYDGSYLQGGISTETRSELFGLYTKSYGRILTPLLILAFIVGILNTTWALTPLRVLNKEILDITDKIESAPRLHPSDTGDQLDMLTHHINGLLQRIEELLQELRGSMDSAAHDLRTPLTRMAGRAEIALRNKEISKKELKQVLVEIIEDNQHILIIFNTLMNITQSEQKLMGDLESFHINDIINQVTELYSLLAEEKEITIHLDCMEHPRLYKGNRFRLTQALSNMLDNAVKYTPVNGNIWITLTHGRGGISIEIENEGTEISPEDEDRIWNRFFRGDSSRSTQGVGLGLSLVKAVIEAHRGTIILTNHRKGWKS
ncbi:MAG: HAMP domain-containing sensor histidine kinase [Spirochaetaceae bacterium]|nr:HAMP domain-containing sensor histidine kinase [Spirochaetaceae bacterium]